MTIYELQQISPLSFDFDYQISGVFDSKDALRVVAGLLNARNARIRWAAIDKQERGKRT